MGGFLYAHRWYATSSHRLTKSHIHPEMVRLAKYRIGYGPAVSILAICVSLVGKRLSSAIFAMIPLLYPIPRRIDHHCLDPREAPEEGAK